MTDPSQMQINDRMRISRRDYRWWYVIASVAGAIIAAWAMQCAPYRRSRLLGTYELLGDRSAAETLTLRDDGTYVQRYGTEVHVGHWEYRPGPFASSVFLDHQRIFVKSAYLDTGTINSDLPVERGIRGPRLLTNPDTDEHYEQVEHSIRVESRQ